MYRKVQEIPEQRQNNSWEEQMRRKKMSSHFLSRPRFYPQFFYLHSCGVSRPLGAICEEDEKILESTGAAVPCPSFALQCFSECLAFWEYPLWWMCWEHQIGWKMMQIDSSIYGELLKALKPWRGEGRAKRILLLSTVQRF